MASIEGGGDGDLVLFLYLQSMHQSLIDTLVQQYQGGCGRRTEEKTGGPLVPLNIQSYCHILLFSPSRCSREPGDLPHATLTLCPS